MTLYLHETSSAPNSDRVSCATAPRVIVAVEASSRAIHGCFMVSRSSRCPPVYAITVIFRMRRVYAVGIQGEA